MYQRNSRGWFASAIVVWSSCLPAVSACDTSGLLSGDCSFSQSTMIGLIIGGVAIVLFIIIFSAVVRRRRSRLRPGRIRRMSVVVDPCNGMQAHPSNPQKPWNTPVAYGSPGYGQPSPPISWSTQAPRYPPPTHDTLYNGHRSEISSQWSSPTTAYPMPEPSTPTSPLSTRTSSSALISRPSPSDDTTPASLRPAVQRDEATRVRPQLSSSSLTRSPQNNVTEPSLPLVPSSPPLRTALMTVAESSPASAPSSPVPQSSQGFAAGLPLSSVSSPPPSRRPTVNILPVSPPPRQPSLDVLQLNPPPPIVLSPMHTGATTNLTEPPPPYTPI